MREGIVKRGLKWKYIQLFFCNKNGLFIIPVHAAYFHRSVEVVGPVLFSVIFTPGLPREMLAQWNSERTFHRVAPQ